MVRNVLCLFALSAVLLGMAACETKENADAVAPQEQAVAAPAAQPADNAQTKEPISSKTSRPPLDLDLRDGVTMSLVWIPAGEFLMGSPDNEEGRFDSETPQHPVRITHGFYMGIYEVTQEQYEAVTGNNPSDFKAPKNPVEQVSWNDAVEFSKKLSAQTGMTAHLPTEAEWEYACRGGTTTRYSFGDEDRDIADVGWYSNNSGDKPNPVGLKKPNPFGLYDMHGNIWEWTADWYEPDYYAKSPVDDPQGPATGTVKAIRGGSWRNEPFRCRSAFRFMLDPPGRNNPIGFRVVIEEPPLR